MDHAHVLALLAALAGTPETAPKPNAAVPPGVTVALQGCPRPLPPSEIDGVTIQCGTLNVPEDRTKPAGRQIAIAFAVMKSSSRYPEPDPVVYLQGGPGGSAVGSIPLLERIFKPWRARRDVVVFDQRSAGLSGASVTCFKALATNTLAITKPPSANVSKDLATPDVIPKCIAELETAGVPLALYNTTENARDVPVIVQALGYKTYNIYGISYGTKLALEVMRVAPANVRSVIIDGVAPSWVRLYNLFAMKTDEAIQHVVDQCVASKACNAAYPDLGRIFVETLNKAASGQIMFRGEKVPVQLVLAPIMSRNGQYDFASVTPYIPAFVYELWRGKEMPTVELLANKNFALPKVGDADVIKATARLTGEQKEIVQQVLDNIAISERAASGTSRAVNELWSSVTTSRKAGPLAGTFDMELGQAMAATLKGQQERLQAALADYTAMQTVPASKERLTAFVTAHFSGAQRDRLIALINGMSASEVDGSFAIIRRDSHAAFRQFLHNFYLDIYACQEDRPYNSFEGYQALTAGLRYPHINMLLDPLAGGFFEACKAFKAQPRDNWHVPVASDIPTLSFGGLYDVQTPASWSKIAIEKLSNSQVFMIPEAGHGTLIYQHCVSEMGVAFIDNPKRKFDNSCAESVKIDWHIAPWVTAAKN